MFFLLLPFFLFAEAQEDCSSLFELEFVSEETPLSQNSVLLSETLESEKALVSHLTQLKKDYVLSVLSDDERIDPESIARFSAFQNDVSITISRVDSSKERKRLNTILFLNFSNTNIEDLGFTSKLDSYGQTWSYHRFFDYEERDESFDVSVIDLPETENKLMIIAQKKFGNTQTFNILLTPKQTVQDPIIKEETLAANRKLVELLTDINKNYSFALKEKNVEFLKFGNVVHFSIRDNSSPFSLYTFSINANKSEVDKSATIEEKQSVISYRQESPYSDYIVYGMILNVEKKEIIVSKIDPFLNQIKESYVITLIPKTKIQKAKDFFRSWF